MGPRQRPQLQLPPHPYGQVVPDPRPGGRHGVGIDPARPHRRPPVRRHRVAGGVARQDAALPAALQELPLVQGPEGLQPGMCVTIVPETEGRQRPVAWL